MQKVTADFYSNLQNYYKFDIKTSKFRKKLFRDAQLSRDHWKVVLKNSYSDFIKVMSVQRCWIYKNISASSAEKYFLVVVIFVKFINLCSNKKNDSKFLLRGDETAKNISASIKNSSNQDK